ncbi:hypothetical protein BD779DRAFT_436117 [Infundibulicybe gibba]|nr:hypothetical protein BD779DRAFT_436117 [Infundibulicybe gibba]
MMPPTMQPGSTGGRLYLKPALCSSVLMFLSVTSHWAINATTSFGAFSLFYGGSAPGDYYHDTMWLLTILKYRTLMVLLTTGDVSMIYRLWIVRSNHSIRRILSAMGFMHGYLESNTGQPQEVFVKAIGRWIVGLCVCSGVTSLYCSALISWAVLKMERATKSFGVRRDLQHSEPSPSRVSFYVSAINEKLILLVPSYLEVGRLLQAGNPMISFFFMGPECDNGIEEW